ncbi:hypothetical protein N7G274_004340 [Stereocaulon virgatum]|uniref:C2H2-type domain-containing protein n=1 Tax=Stereocaulon virgatum TaxID=373712 RepID=A0ABR4AAV7_9LECA
MDQPLEGTTTLTASMSESDDSTLSLSASRTITTVLQDFSDEQIITWLTLLRSLQPGYQHLASSQALTSHQIEALSSLKDYPDNYVLGLLHINQRAERSQTLSHTSNNDLFTGLINSAPSYRPRQASLSSVPQSSSSSLGPWTPCSRNTSGTSQGDLSFEFSKQASYNTISSSSLSINGTHTHWCTVCEKPKSMTTCDGWKRHMREHETIYHCMPQGPLKFTETGPECVFCDLPSDQKHLDTHSIHQCLEKPRTYRRKAELVKHLEIHGVSDGTNIAEQWQVAFRKKFFSCGFCIAVFYNINDQLNHIDHDHYRRSEDIFNWDFTKVIKGLLLQPGMDIAWQNVSADYSEPGFSWDPSTSKLLQRRLELAEETVQDLAVAAFNESIYDWNHHNSDEPDLTMSIAIPVEDRLHNIPVHSVQETPLVDRRMTANIPQYQVQTRPLDGTRHSESGLFRTYPAESSNGSLDDLAVMEYQHKDVGVHSPLFPANDINLASFQDLPQEAQTGMASALKESTDGTTPSDVRSNETLFGQSVSEWRAVISSSSEMMAVLEE